MQYFGTANESSGNFDQVESESSSIFVVREKDGNCATTAFIKRNLDTNSSIDIIFNHDRAKVDEG